MCSSGKTAETIESAARIQATRNGQVKKTALSAYSRPRRGGIIAMNILEDDALVEAWISDGDQEIIVATRNGQAVRFHENEVRPTGRGSQGVRGISLEGDDIVIGMVVADDSTALLTVCELGYGKRTQVSDYRLTRRGIRTQPSSQIPHLSLHLE